MKYTHWARLVACLCVCAMFSLALPAGVVLAGEPMVNALENAGIQAPVDGQLVQDMPADNPPGRMPEPAEMAEDPTLEDLPAEAEDLPVAVGEGTGPEIPPTEEADGKNPAGDEPPLETVPEGESILEETPEGELMPGTESTPEELPGDASVPGELPGNESNSEEPAEGEEDAEDTPIPEEPVEDPPTEAQPEGGAPAPVFPAEPPEPTPLPVQPPIESPEEPAATSVPEVDDEAPQDEPALETEPDVESKPNAEIAPPSEEGIPSQTLPPVDEAAPPQTPPSGITPPVWTDGVSLPPEAEKTPVSIVTGDYGPIKALPGDTIDIAIPIELLYEEQWYASNLDAQKPQPLPYHPDGTPMLYDQTIAALLDFVRVEVSRTPGQPLPFDIAEDQVQRDVISDGENHGYAVIRGVVVPENTTPGNYSLPVAIWWMQAVDAAEGAPQDDLQAEHPQAQMQQAQITITVLPPAVSDPVPFAGVAWGDGVIVYSHADLRQALESGLYQTIYLGYSDANGGVIAYEDGKGIAIASSVTIDGIDPATGRQMQLTDWMGTQPRNGMYAKQGGLQITLRNMSITGYNWYGIVYGSDVAGVCLRFENIQFTGRQMAHNQGGGSSVIFSNCTIAITNVGSGGEEEVVETGDVTFYGDNTVRRTGPQDHSLFWLKNGGHSLTIASGATVRLETTDYIIYTEGSANTRLDVQGALYVVTTGGRGSMTYDEQYIGSLSVSRGAVLDIRHENTVHATLKAASVSVMGTLSIHKAGSIYPTIRLENGGSLRFDGDILLDNPGGCILRSRGGTASMTWIAPVINRYTGGSIAGSWNNADFASFTVSLQATGTGATVTAVSGLEQNGRGAAPEGPALSGALPLATDNRLILTAGALRLDDIYGGSRSVGGNAASGASVTVSEYTYTPELGAVQALQRTATSAQGGRFDTASAPFGTPIRASGTRVYATSDDGTIVCHTYAIPIASGPILLEVPDTLAFETARLSARDQIVARAIPDWRIVIEDTHGEGSTFRLYARIQAPLTSKSGDTLAGALAFTQSGTTTPLTDKDLMIAEGTSIDGVDTYVFRWPEGEGLQVHLPAFAGIPEEPYATTIEWTLVEGP